MSQQPIEDTTKTAPEAVITMDKPEAPDIQANPVTIKDVPITSEKDSSEKKQQTTTATGTSQEEHTAEHHEETEDFHAAVLKEAGVKEFEEENLEHHEFNHEQTEHEEADPANTAKDLDKLLEIEAMNVEDWTKVHESQNIKVFKKKDDDNPVILIKCYATFESIPPEKVFTMIYDLELRKQWDNILSNMKAFGKVNEDIDHMYSLYKAPIGISNRDFCQRRTKAQNYKGVPYIIDFVSVSHKDCPPVAKVVRAHTYISGYIIRPSAAHPGGTDMTILTQTDIKGKLPKLLVNMAAATAPSNWCKNFKKQAELLMKEGKI